MIKRLLYAVLGAVVGWIFFLAIVLFHPYRQKYQREAWEAIKADLASLFSGGTQ